MSFKKIANLFCDPFSNNKIKKKRHFYFIIIPIHIGTYERSEWEREGERERVEKIHKFIQP